MERRHLYIFSILALLIAMVGTQVTFAQVSESDNLPADSKEDGRLEALTALAARSATVPTCTDDSFEPNNTLADATPVNATVVGTTYADLKICSANDVDVFKITVPANHQVRFDVLFSHAISNIDFGVYNSATDVLGGGVSSTDNETDIVTNNSASEIEWTIIVFNNGTTENTYSLNLTLNPPCSDDSFEENDSLASPKTLAVPSNNQGLVLCDSDADVYAVTVPAGGFVRVDVLFDHSISNLDIFIYSSAGVELDRSEDTTDNEYVLMPNYSSAPVTYSLVIINADYNFADNPYSLKITNEGACVDDSYEENDTATSTTPLVFPSNNANLMMCNQDTDNYLVTVPAGTNVIIDLVFSNKISDLELDVFEDVTGFPLVAGSFSSTDNEQVSFQNTTSAPINYWVRVDNFDSRLSHNPYSLNIREGTITKVYLPVLMK